MAELIGTKAADKITGTTLQDLIIAQGENDIIDGSDGDDEIYAGSGDDTVLGSDGNDFINAGTGQDFISDGAGNDVVWAGEGNDRVLAGIGDDIYQGGKGFDTIDFSASEQGITVDLSKGFSSGQGNDVVQGFERIIGSSFADDIKGSSAADVIIAGDGKNEIRGMGGADDLTGGMHRDVFAWKASDLLDANGDHRGVDTIHLFENNDGLDISNILRDVVYDNLDDLVLLTDTDEGTLLQVKINDTFVDVALLADVHTGGATAAAWASDGLILA